MLRCNSKDGIAYAEEKFISYICGPGKFRLKTDAMSGERMLFSPQLMSSPCMHTECTRQGSSGVGRWGVFIRH